MGSTQPGGPLGGILLYSAGVFFFAVNDALGKWLVKDYGVAQVMSLRAVGALVVLVPALYAGRATLRRPQQVGLQCARIATSAVDTFCFYFATRSMPLADVMTFYLATPLIVVALSSTMLGERVGLHRWLAVGLGFVGVLIALRPSGAAFSPAALIALFGSLMFALTITITRQLRGTHWLQLVACQVVGSGLVGTLVMPFDWVAPTLRDTGLMFLVGIVSMACFMCITKALAVAAASLLAPFQYLSIVWAALLGWLVWGDIPSNAVVAGSLVIIASGLFVVRRERVPLPA